MIACPRRVAAAALSGAALALPLAAVATPAHADAAQPFSNSHCEDFGYAQYCTTDKGVYKFDTNSSGITHLVVNGDYSWVVTYSSGEVYVGSGSTHLELHRRADETQEFEYHVRTRDMATYPGETCYFSYDMHVTRTAVQRSNPVVDCS